MHQASFISMQLVSTLGMFTRIHPFNKCLNTAVLRISGRASQALFTDRSIRPCASFGLRTRHLQQPLPDKELGRF